MVKFPEAQTRMFRGKVACRKCKTVIKAPTAKVIKGEVSCRRCGNKTLRPLRKK